MLQLHDSIPNMAVLSLRTGGPVGRVLAPIINPNNLYIEGWHVEDDISRQRLILLSNDVRDVMPQGLVINDHEVLVQQKELVRLADILELQFDPIGLKVVSEAGTKYGKINDYAFETTNAYIQKLYAMQSLVKNFKGGAVSIDRSQINEITDKRIVIEDPFENAQARATSPSGI